MKHIIVPQDVAGGLRLDAVAASSVLPGDDALSSAAERWPSGRRRTPGKCVGGVPVSRVRIPLSPPNILLIH